MKTEHTTETEINKPSYGKGFYPLFYASSIKI